jgi:hypothetical protein
MVVFSNTFIYTCHTSLRPPCRDDDREDQVVGEAKDAELSADRLAQETEQGLPMLAIDGGDRRRARLVLPGERSR